jgi:hypothetical protein
MAPSQRYNSKSILLDKINCVKQTEACCLLPLPWEKVSIFLYLIVAKKWMKTQFDSRTGTGKKDFEW